jgi:hypothetical protein
VNVTPDEALSLLRKWREENRLIQCFLIFSATTSACIVGHITELTDDFIRVTSAPRCGIQFSLSDAQGISFEDWREAPPEHAEQLKEAYEAFLSVRFRNYHCELYAAKTVGELPAI